MWSTIISENVVKIFIGNYWFSILNGPAPVMIFHPKIHTIPYDFRLCDGYKHEELDCIKIYLTLKSLTAIIRIQLCSM